MAADVQKGIQLYQDGKYKEAAAEITQVLKQSPDDVRAHFYLGLTLLNQNQFKEAESHFLSAEKKPNADSRPTLDQIKVGLACAQMEQKDYDGALQNLEAARTINSENPEVYVYRGKLELHQGNYAAALEHLQKAIKMDPKNEYAHYYAGMAYGKVGRPDKMITEFQTFMKLVPNAPEVPKIRSLLRGIR